MSNKEYNELLDRFAIAALPQVIEERSKYVSFNPRDIADHTFRIAKEMIETREKHVKK